MKIFTLIIAISLFIGCQNKKANIKNNLVVFDLQNLNEKSKAKLSDLGVDNIQYIPLQTDTNCLISIIREFKSAENSFIILDNSGQIYRFGFDGRFINKIGKTGRGPGEYRLPSDYTIDNQEQQVFILPIEQPDIYVYSLNGKFLNTIPALVRTRKIFYMDEGIFCWRDNYGGTGNINNTVVRVDKKGNITKEFPEKYKYKNITYPNGFLEEYLMYSFDGNLYTKEIYSDTVFTFKNNEFTPAFILDHGGTTLSVEAREKIINDKTVREIAFNHSREIKLFQFGNYDYSEFIYHDDGFGFIGSFDGKSKFLINLNEGIINDFDGGLNFYPQTTLDNNTIINWINPLELKAHIASETFKNSIPKYPKKKKELEQLANSLNENDNPVLMLVKLEE